MRKVSAIVPAAGASQRMGTDKLLLDCGGMTVLLRSLLLLENNPLISEIVVAARDPEYIKRLAAENGVTKLKDAVNGGENRFRSVQNAVAACSSDAEYLCIHDAARPFASDALVTAVIEAAFEHGAAAPCLPIYDTVKELTDDGMVFRTPNRSRLRTVATPQVFRASFYKDAARGESDAFDDCELLERKGYEIFPVAGERSNIKITEPGDIEQAMYMKGENGMRVGHGYDVHRLVEGRRLILGGVEIPFEEGLLGHSDADVLMHAVIDALLGAAALGDIGSHFPDSDDKYKDINSLLLLKATAVLLKNEGFEVVNIDSTVLCERPKLRPHIDSMRSNIATALGADIEAVSVKATTEEGLGFTGEGQGIAAHAVALLRKIKVA